MDDEKETQGSCASNLPEIPWLEKISDEVSAPPDTDFIARLEELEYR